jgi:hypothetical protein
MNTASSSLPQPSLLGLQPSFGFGDRLGLATPGHIAACRLGRLRPIFAQQSVREMTRTQRTPEEVMLAAQRGIASESWTEAWGADGDHLKTEDDVKQLAAAGFTFFTIDPSAHVQNEADQLRGEDLAKAAEAVVQSGAFASLAEAESLYLGQQHELPGADPLTFSEAEPLYRAIVKYGKAVAHSAQMAEWIARETGERGGEIEVSVDETDTPTSPLEHLFIGLELKRRGVRPVSVAPRFIGEFEKGVDYKGDLALFEATLQQHVAIAKYCGPYKISIHSGSDKFALYPIIGRVCGDLLHVKTAGTSYLEALRVVARESPRLFGTIVDFARSRFEADRATYHISAKLDDVPAPEGLSLEERERHYLNEDAGRQILHVTFGSVLTNGKAAGGRTFKEGIMETLQSYADLHKEVLTEHLGRHITLLSAG